MRRLASALALLAACGVAPVSAQTPTPVDSDPAYEDASIQWMNYLQAGHFDSAAMHVSPQVIAQMGEEQLTILWPQITAQVGAMHDLQPEKQGDLNGLRVVKLAGTFDAGVFDVNVVYDAEMKVVGFSVTPPSGG
jgi:hypothetical protein